MKSPLQNSSAVPQLPVLPSVLPCTMPSQVLAVQDDFNKQVWIVVLGSNICFAG
jgi:hypothetical protein